MRKGCRPGQKVPRFQLEQTILKRPESCFQKPPLHRIHRDRFGRRYIEEFGVKNRDIFLDKVSTLYRDLSSS